MTNRIAELKLRPTAKCKVCEEHVPEGHMSSVKKGTCDTCEQNQP